MEGFYSFRNPRAPKLSGANVSPVVNTQMESPFFGPNDRRHLVASNSSGFNTYASDMDTTLARYLRSRSSVTGVINPGELFANPAMNTAEKHHHMLRHGNAARGFFSRGGSALARPLSAVENIASPMFMSSTFFGTPMMHEEDVIVMDGIPIGGRMRKSGMSDSSSSSTSSAGNVLYKTEICRVWVETGNCRYGSKCQFAHGKEELRPIRFHGKNKSEAQSCKSHASSGSSRRLVHHPLIAASESPVPAAARHRQACSHTSIAVGPSGGDCWLPHDDGIPAVLPFSWAREKEPLTREQTEGLINDLLYGDPNCKKRLGVFAEISLDD